MAAEKQLQSMQEEINETYSEIPIGLYYKDGKYTYFSINTDAKCIRISDNTGVIYYYKRYNEKAVDEIFNSLNN